MKYFIIYMLIGTYLLTASVDMPKDDLNTAEVKKVKKFYKKYFQKACHYTAANFAQMRTQAQWEKLEDTENFIHEVIHICPNATDMVAKILIKATGKEKFDYLRRFSIQYAKDTGKFPPC